MRENFFIFLFRKRKHVGDNRVSCKENQNKGEINNLVWKKIMIITKDKLTENRTTSINAKRILISASLFSQ